MNMHHKLKYLVQISEKSKLIGDLRKKIEFHNRGTHGYEREMWGLYR